jgi:Ca2+-binding RTX toxin-like protein
MLTHRLLTPLLAALAVAALPAAAGASTISLEGDVLVVRAATGEKNWLTVGPAESAGRVSISDISAPAADPSLCTADEYSTFVSCVTPSGGVRLEAGDREDILDVQDNLPVGIPVTLDGGAGNDVLRGAAFTETTDRLLGGDGNDKITGGSGADTVEGGAGDDELDPRQGPDVVHGGDGNDKLGGDYWGEQSTDVIDGGAGYDQIEGNWMSESGEYQPPIVVSIDGVANDGRPGENDNVTAVERIYLNAPATLTGSDGPDEFTIFNTDAGSTFNGRGGDDKLSGFDLDDTIDGGAGNDAIEGGYGHDTITGGPGRDVINGDANGSTCHWIQCRSPYGNDRIDARDGEADDITCGVGEDVVEADPADTVAPDCETVRRGGVAGGGAGDNQQPGQIQPGAASLTRVKAVRRGGKLVVTGRATGTSRVKVSVVRGRRTVARAQAAVRSGRFTVRVRAPRHVRVTVTAGAARRTLKVR